MAKQLIGVDAQHDGVLLDDDQAARNAMATGMLVALPVEPALLDRGPVSGYFRRGWGRGVRLDRMAPQRVCGMLLWASPDYGFLHWTARIIPTSDRGARGSIRLATIPTAAGGFVGGLAATAKAVDLTQLGAEGPHGGWTIGGVVGFGCATDGYIALGLLAQADGVAVVWSAVTQCARSE